MQIIYAGTGRQSSSTSFHSHIDDKFVCSGRLSSTPHNNTVYYRSWTLVAIVNMLSSLKLGRENKRPQLIPWRYCIKYLKPRNYVGKFPNGSGNSRVLPEIPEFFLKFPNGSGNSWVLPKIPEYFRKFKIFLHHFRSLDGLKSDKSLGYVVTCCLILIKQVLGLQKQRFWSHFSTD